VRQIAVLVNKMDMVGYDEKTFREIEKEYREYLRSLGVTPTCFIPVSARDGDGILPSHRRGEARRGASDYHTYPISDTKKFARKLRKEMTSAEQIIWGLLRGKQLGIKFRKQHPVGPYIADFACLNPKIIIELDGSQHANEHNLAKDKKRSEFLNSQGFKVIRFWNNEVFENIDSVVETIYNSFNFEQESSHPNPPPNGEGIPNMPWYSGESVTEMLEKFEVASADASLPLRFPIQDIYKFDERRILVGRIESGSLKVGDELLFSPSNTLAKIASIEAWPDDNKPTTASAGQSIGITLTDQIFVERGHIASHVERAPLLTSLFRARIFWLGHRPLEQGKRYKIKIGTSEIMAEIKTIEHVIDADTLEQIPANRVERSNVAEIILRVRGLAVVDDFANNQRLGRFVILQDYDVAGGGIINMDGFFDQRAGKPQKVKSDNIFEVDFGVTKEQRALANGHMGGILWFSGLSGSGKSTIAKLLQKRLFDKGYQVFVLDGDNIRKGLNRDLGFSAEDRAENLRRVAETAALFAKAGVIVISAFISPTTESRHTARAIAPNYFHSIYIKASLETCEKRDVKGLYAKARAGEIPEFTGITAPFEEPHNPDIVINTEELSVQACVEQLLKYVDQQLVEPARNMEIETSGDYSGVGI
jgi:bifunctional enzyme CysN/CysC